MSLAVGQELWFVHRERRSGVPHAVTVTKVGRKWASISEWGIRIDIETMVADGGGLSSPGRCWLSREAWEQEEERQKAWGRLREFFNRRWSAPDGISIDAIRQATALLSEECGVGG